MDLYDESYNPQGKVMENWEIARMFTHLFGDENFMGGVYSLNNLKDFMDDMEDADIALFDQAIDNMVWMLIGGSGEYPSGLEFPERKELPSLRAFQALCSQVDVDGNGVLDKSLIYLLLRVFKLETDMSALLEDFVVLFDTPELYPGGALYNNIMKVIDLVEEDL